MRLNSPYPITGRGTLLLLHTARQSQGRILLLAKPRVRFKRRRPLSAVAIFGEELDHDCVDLDVDKRKTVAVLTATAPWGPKISNGRFTKNPDVDHLGEKILLTYRITGHSGKFMCVALPPGAHLMLATDTHG